MSGEVDLQVLVATMAAEVLPGRFVFSTVTGSDVADDIDVLARACEPEGLSLVTTQDEADRAGLAHDLVAGWITSRGTRVGMSSARRPRSARRSRAVG